MNLNLQGRTYSFVILTQLFCKLLFVVNYAIRPSVIFLFDLSWLTFADILKRNVVCGETVLFSDDLWWFALGSSLTTGLMRRNMPLPSISSIFHRWASPSTRKIAPRLLWPPLKKATGVLATNCCITLEIFASRWKRLWQ